jgi:hypothetical protein
VATAEPAKATTRKPAATKKKTETPATTPPAATGE